MNWLLLGVLMERFQARYELMLNRVLRDCPPAFDEASGTTTRASRHYNGCSPFQRPPEPSPGCGSRRAWKQAWHESQAEAGRREANRASGCEIVPHNRKRPAREQAGPPFKCGAVVPPRYL